MDKSTSNLVATHSTNTSGKNMDNSENNMNLSPAALAQFLDLIGPLLKDSKDDKVVHVGPWVVDAKDRFESFGIPEQYWVTLAKMKLPSQVNNEFMEWAIMNERNKKDWNAFEEFLLKKYAGVANQLDAFIKWSNLVPPRNSQEFDNFIENFKLLAIMAKLDPTSPHCAMNFLIRMPNSILQRMMANANDKTAITLESVISYGRAHFTAMKIRDDANKMEVDMITTSNHQTEETNVKAINYVRPGRNLPQYEWFKTLVTRQEFDQRLASRLCIGCGERHFWRNCPKNPKGQQN